MTFGVWAVGGSKRAQADGATNAMFCSSTNFSHSILTTSTTNALQHDLPLQGSGTIDDLSPSAPNLFSDSSTKRPRTTRMPSIGATQLFSATGGGPVSDGNILLYTTLALALSSFVLSLFVLGRDLLTDGSRRLPHLTASSARRTLLFALYFPFSLLIRCRGGGRGSPLARLPASG